MAGSAPLVHPSKLRYRWHTPACHALGRPDSLGVKSSATWTVPISPLER